MSCYSKMERTKMANKKITKVDNKIKRLLSTIMHSVPFKPNISELQKILEMYI